MDTSATATNSSAPAIPAPPTPQCCRPRQVPWWCSRPCCWRPLARHDRSSPRRRWRVPSSTSATCGRSSRVSWSSSPRSLCHHPLHLCHCRWPHRCRSSPTHMGCLVTPCPRVRYRWQRHRRCQSTKSHSRVHHHKFQWVLGPSAPLQPTSAPAYSSTPRPTVPTAPAPGAIAYHGGPHASGTMYGGVDGPLFHGGSL